VNRSIAAFSGLLANEIGLIATAYQINAG